MWILLRRSTCPKPSRAFPVTESRIIYCTVRRRHRPVPALNQNAGLAQPSRRIRKNKLPTTVAGSSVCGVSQQNNNYALNKKKPSGINSPSAFIDRRWANPVVPLQVASTPKNTPNIFFRQTYVRQRMEDFSIAWRQKGIRCINREFFHRES